MAITVKEIIRKISYISKYYSACRKEHCQVGWWIRQIHVNPSILSKLKIRIMLRILSKYNIYVTREKGISSYMSVNQ
jgi:hypothetical protein